jgi:hypothetical protein
VLNIASSWEALKLHFAEEFVEVKNMDAKSV